MMKYNANTILAWAALLTAVVTAGQSAAQPTVVASSDTAVVDTDAGTIQGYIRDGVNTFKGIPYATAGRFMPPAKVEPWSDTRMALSYGHICPQPISIDVPAQQVFLSDWRFWPTSENCQNLNVWTPAPDDGKRPVMVWLHGGGFFSGSSLELPVYDGTNLAASGDVVVVSLNHRLNVLGYLDLSAYGDEFSSSGNAGMLDIVAALQWVQGNIGSFGGDPGNVTIFGQSGGGAKVATLMTTPAAKGLFHKAIIQSGAPGGAFPSALDQTVAKRVAELTFEFAGVEAGNVGQLQALGFDDLHAAASQAIEAAGEELGIRGISWSPVADGDWLPEAPFASKAPDVSTGIPLLVGSTLAEFSQINPQLAGRQGWGGDEVESFVQERYGDAASAVMDTYRNAYPELEPKDWVIVETMFRSAVIRTAQLKSAQGDPVYSYIFAWRSPVLDYAWAAGHTGDVAFVFNNPDLGEQSTGGGPEVRALAGTISQAWVNFARHGNPNHDGMPEWRPWTSEDPATMILDDAPDLRVGHDTELIRLLSQ